ncbi:MAG: hypothetical protein GX107_08790 [Clostridiales bacterium]|jgi:uncharacterized protein YjdB|nr:hypothetical protein [Clostridiales bacterium]
MKRSLKSFLAIFLAFAMLFGGAPAGALAALPSRLGGLTANAVDQFGCMDADTVPVTGVSLNENSLSIATGGTAQLTAEVSPADATDKSIAWSSSSAAATVDENGLVTAISPGTATITVTTTDGGFTDECEVTVTPVELSRIEIKTLPDKTSYFVGDTLDTTGLTIKAVFSNGTEQTITSGFDCSPTSLTSAGAKTITVSYGGKDCTFLVTVTDVTLTSIELLSEPLKTVYYVGDTLDTTGLTIKAIFNNDTDVTVTGGFTCSPMELNTAGTQEITVKYGGKTCTFDVTVSEAELTEIEVETQPEKTTYYADETLDTTGLTIKATFSNGSEQIITSGFDCSPMLLNTAGTQEITVTYNSMICTFDVEVTAIELTSLAVETLPDKTIYDIGDTLDTTGLSLKATYNNGDTQIITSGFTCSPMELNTAGTRTISVSYSVKVCSFTVTVRKIEANRFTIAAIPDQTYTGLQIKPFLTIKYNNITLSPVTDYTVTYVSNTDVGSASAVVTGIGRFSGTSTVVFRILPRDISRAISDGIPYQGYTGSEIMPELSIHDNGYALVRGTDYEVSYSDNVAIGTATITIDGKGNYKGTKSAYFQIVSTFEPTFTVGEIADQKYTGFGISPPVSAYSKNNVESLTDTVDYVTDYRANTLPGMAAASVGGIGNHRGVVDKGFIILTESILAAQADDIPDMTKTGGALKPTPVLTYKGRQLVMGVDFTAEYSNNIEPGTATVTIIGDGGFDGTRTINFNITENTANFTVDTIPDQVYTGGALMPPVIVRDGFAVLKVNVNYKVAYTFNIDAGYAVATVTGIGGHSGTFTVVFRILCASIEAAEIPSIPDTVFSNSKVTPDFSDIVITYGGAVLEPNIDFKAEVYNNYNAGAAAVIIIGIGNFSGMAQRFFNIAQASVNDFEIDTINDVIYTGAAIAPAFGVSFGGISLRAGIDYTVTIADNIDVGTATVHIVGIGNYTGARQVTFKIKPADAAGFDVTAIQDMNYTGLAIMPTTAVKFGDMLLTQNVDYKAEYTNNINAGTATMIISGIGNFAGVKQITFTIKPAEAESVFAAPIPDLTYDGSAQTPGVYLAFNGMSLELGKDFTTTYTNNINAGTATVTITGKGNYTGTKQVAFVISHADASLFAAAPIPDYVYSGTATAPAVSLTFNGTPLTLGVDYTVIYTNNINAGTATVTITGIGNYTGTKQVNYKIKQADAADFVISPIPNVIYTGRAFTPTVSVTFNGRIMTLGIDYTVEYTNNINIGTATVFITGKGNFSRTTSVTFEILIIPVDSISLDYKELSLIYRNSQSLTVTFSPADATIKNVTWTSSDTSVATVDANGKVTAKGRGTATITATSEDGGYKATCNVTVTYVWWQWLIKILLFGWIWY